MSMITNTGRGILFDNRVHLPDDGIHRPMIAGLTDLETARDQLAITVKEEAVPNALAHSVEGRTAVALARHLRTDLLKRKQAALDADQRAFELLTDPATGSNGGRCIAASLLPIRPIVSQRRAWKN
jgi:hypothetical protein